MVQYMADRFRTQAPARDTASRLAATAYLVPPITIVMRWLILGA